MDVADGAAPIRSLLRLLLLPMPPLPLLFAMVVLVRLLLHLMSLLICLLWLQPKPRLQSQLMSMLGMMLIVRLMLMVHTAVAICLRCELFCRGLLLMPLQTLMGFADAVMPHSLLLLARLPLPLPPLLPTLLRVAAASDCCAKSR